MSEAKRGGLMTASQQAKAAGLKSLTQVSEMTGASLQTLTNWAKNKPDLFKTVLAGCVARNLYSHRRDLKT